MKITQWRIAQHQICDRYFNLKSWAASNHSVYLFGNTINVAATKVTKCEHRHCLVTWNTCCYPLTTQSRVLISITFRQSKEISKINKVASNNFIREKRTTIRQSTSLSPPCLFESYKRLNGRFNVLLNWWKSLLYFIGWSNLQDFPSFRNLHSKQETFEAQNPFLWQQSTNEILWWHSNFDFVLFVITLSGLRSPTTPSRWIAVSGWLFSDIDIQAK